MKKMTNANPEAELAELLLGVSMLLMKRLAAHMRNSDQHLEPSHAGLLAKIGEGECKMSDLAEHQCVQLPTISRSVNVMVERGLVERRIPESNRRTTMVSLTRKGRTALNKLMRDARSHTEELLADLSDREKQSVRAGLSVLSQTLAPDASELRHSDQRQSLIRTAQHG